MFMHSMCIECYGHRTLASSPCSLTHHTQVSGARSPLQRKPENQGTAGAASTTASLDSIKARLARMKKQSTA